MCGCEMIRTCMIVRNFKLYVWNWYFRRYVLFGCNAICIMYDKVSVHILIVFTAVWKLYISELKVVQSIKTCM